MPNMEWLQDAACLDADWDMTDNRHTLQSKKMCNVCPVLDPCHLYAMTDHAVGVPGVLAGLTFNERGQVECATCPAIVRKTDTRHGQCWSCYKEKVA